MKFYLFILFFILAVTSAMAQSFSISGVITDEQNETVPGVNVQLLITSADSMYDFTQSDIDGVFTFQKVQPGSYLLKIQYIGFEPIERNIQVNSQNINLGKIQLKPIQLKEVLIIGRIPPAVQKGDTTELNAAAFKTNPDASSEDLVRKMPGVTITDGKVQAQGEDVKQVLVDGKPFFGDDPSATLKNLPAELVDKIQIFDDPGEQARRTGTSDGNTSKTINIVTKPNMRNGQFGEVYAGYGTDNRYQAGVTANFFKNDRRITILGQTNNINIQNFAIEDLVGMSGGSGGGGMRGMRGPGGGGWRGGGGSDISDFLVGGRSGISTTHAFGINYADKWSEKVNVTGSYFFNLGDNEARQDVYRQFVLQRTSGQTYAENSLSNSLNRNHRLNFRFDWKIDSMNTILIRPRLSLQQNNGNSALLGETRQNQNLLNSTNNRLLTNLLGYTFSNEVLYTHRFAKKGRSISLSNSQNISYNDGFRNLNSMNLLLEDSLNFNVDSIQQNAELVSKTTSVSSNITYSEPVGKFGTLSFTYNNSFQQSNSVRNTYDLTEASSKYLDTSLSNKFSSNYSTQRGGIGYRYNKEKINTFLQLNYEHALLKNIQQFPTDTSITRKFNNFLPTATIGYSISKTKNLRLFYRTSANAPSISQLQNVIDNSNPLQIRTGNEDLQQEYRNNIFLRYSASNPTKGTSFFAMLGGETSKNYIGNSNFIAQKDTFLTETVLLPAGGQFIMPVNIQGRYSLRSFINYGFPVKHIKSNINLNGHALFNRTPGIINNQLNYSHTQTYGAGFVVSSNFSPKVDFTVSTNASYNYVQNTLQRQLNNTYYSQNSRFSMNWIFWKDFVFNTELNHQVYSGLTGGFNQNYLLWNMNFGKKFLKNNAADLRLAVFDILKQNNSISRNVTEAYIEDLQSNVLQQYVMLIFTYNFRNFGGKNTNSPPADDIAPAPQR